MIRLLNIELLKLLPYKTFRVLMLIYLVLLFCILLVADDFFGRIGAPKEQILQFPNIWNYYTFCAAYLNIILAIIIIFITCNEITYRTLRQNVIDGLTRAEVVFSKIYLILFLAISITVFVFFSGLIAGTINGTIPGGGYFTDHIEFLFAFFIQTLGVMCLGFLLGNLFKRSAIAIIMFLIFLFPIDLIIREAILPEGGSNYLPVTTYFLKMIPAPTSHILSHGEEPTHDLPTALSLAVGGAYVLVFIIGNWLLIRRRDL
jgi:ABC-type transport system involved in multi-copper enzyme maturation permease subunit